MTAEIQNLYELNRQQVLNLEHIKAEVNRLRGGNSIQAKFREVLNTRLCTTLADLLQLNELLVEAANCLDEHDLEWLLSGELLGDN